MLAESGFPEHVPPKREHSHLNLQYDKPPDTAPVSPLTMDDRICPGCQTSAVTENGGLVVAFGQSFFHVDCFKCAKCANQVTADTNLLLLSDGSPICANCSYSCNICQLPILDEAIMTGDDSYHAHCFKCKVCHNRIDELVFAKTSQGIYCMSCHNERTIKIRKHAQRKAEREKEKASGGSSSRSKKIQDPSHVSEFGTKSSSNPSGSRSKSGSRPSSSRAQDVPVEPGTPGHRSGRHSGYVNDAFEPQQSAPSKSQVPPSSPIPVVVAPSQIEESIRPLPPIKSNMPVENSDGGRRYDDGIRPLDVLFKQKVEPPDNNTPEGLNVASSRRDKRRSINPGLSLSSFNRPTTPPTRTSPSLSPNSANANSTFFAQQQTALRRSPTPPISANGRDSLTASPRRENFPSERPISNSSSHHSRHSSGSSSPSNRIDDPSERTVTEDVIKPDRLTRVPPPRTDSLGRAEVFGRTDPSPSFALNGTSLRSQRSFDERASTQEHRTSGHSINDKRSRSASHSRPNSRADVPHSVESGTDTEPEIVPQAQRFDEASTPIQAVHDSPPALPPKETTTPTIKVPTVGTLPPEVVLSPMSSEADVDSDLSESSPVERVSHSTFIAPALPPIRFSMNSADFSDMLSTVGGNPSLRQLAKLSENADGEMTAVPTTPPPSAATLSMPIPDISTPRGPERVSPEPQAGDIKYSTLKNENSQRPLSNGKTPSYTGDQPSTPPEVPAATNLSRTKSESSRKKAAADEVRTIGMNDFTSASSRVTLTEPDSSVSRPLRHEPPDLVLRRLQEALTDATERGAQQLKFDKGFIEAIFNVMESRSFELKAMKGSIDGIKRTSKQYIDGLTVAQEEYDKELKARRDAEAEVTRLRVLLSGQVARLTALSSDSRRQELREQLSKELSDNLTGLEHDLSKLRVERDMTIAEVEELSASKGSPGLSNEAPAAAGNLGRSLTVRLDKIKVQYKKELIPLTEQREALTREIKELRGVRDVFLEETTVLNARNEELAQLSAQYARRMESIPEALSQVLHPAPLREQKSFDKPKAIPQQPQAPPFTQSLSSSTTMSSHSIQSDESSDTSRYLKIQKVDTELTTPQKPKFIKWPGSKMKETPTMVAHIPEPISRSKTEGHLFQQLSVLRFTRCDHCNEKMWGSQLRCSVCTMSIHVRCANLVHTACQQSGEPVLENNTPPPPSMFGRLLTEQVHADANGDERQVPVIVEKCIDAVEILALDYEGIYRKTGGSSQTRAITSLFERGDYDAFDLRDNDRFNDICSITSVLKTYFRSLPIPLLTYDLHERFMAAVQNKDIPIKNKTLLELVRSLPSEHYYTLRMLMLHLYHVREQSEQNKMNARNLGVVFGPTLMRSPDPGAEFSDMAGKALSIEWLVENAPFIFNETQSY